MNDAISGANPGNGSDCSVITIIFKVILLSDRLLQGVLRGEAKMANSSEKEKSNKPQADSCRPERLDCLNYCVSGMLSRCGAGPEWQKQKKCKYYKRSTIRDRCMHYIETLGGHCDCVDAQLEVRRQKDLEDD
jgi:hypothetical protein